MQTSIPKIGQFGHTFKRGLVRSVTERAHIPGPGPENLWKNISIFVGGPALLLSGINCYLQTQDGHHERPEVIDYPYMKILNKPFPWRDGKRSLFHNPHTNYVPGVGYEA